MKVYAIWTDGYEPYLASNILLTSEEKANRIAKYLSERFERVTGIKDDFWVEELTVKSII
jgi:hypothetical protein